MPFTLDITDGTTTVTLTNSAVGYVMEFNPGTPQKEIVEATRAVRDGGEITGSSKKNVSGTIRVLLMGGETTVRANKALLEQLMEQADVFQANKIEPRVYMRFNKDGVSETYRSEVLVGRVVPNDNWLLQLAVSGTAEVTIFYTRRYYWEGAEVFLPLTNKWGSNVTSGLQFDNSNDANRDNFVTIASGDILGDIAAPCRLEITNTFASAVRTGAFFVGHQARSGLSASETVFEGESIQGSSIAANTANAPSSNGNYTTLTWSGLSEVKAGYWVLSSTMLNNANGGSFRVLLVTAGSGGINNTYVKVKIALDDASAPSVWESGYVKADANSPITEIATIRLPPYLGYGNGIAQLRLELWVQNPTWTSGSTIATLDFLQLLPVESYRIVQQKSFGLPQTYTLHVDDIAEYAYTDASGKLGNFIATGSPIMLVPGKTNRLYFVANSWINTFQGDRTHTLKVAFRPRKLVV